MQAVRYPAGNTAILRWFSLRTAGNYQTVSGAIPGRVMNGKTGSDGYHEYSPAIPHTFLIPHHPPLP